MKGIGFAFSLISGLFLICSAVYADFYAIAGSKNVGKEIKNLPYTISEPGFYYIWY